MIFYFLYRTLIWPALRAIFFLLSLSNRKIRSGLEMRRVLANGKKPWLNFPQASRPVWIHCASGEFEYAKPVITRLKELKPDVKVLVTYFSPSAAPIVNRFQAVDFSCPLPWDAPNELNEFIDWHKPRALLIARTDVWPEMVRTAHTRGIPSLLFAATLAKESGRARGLGGWASSASLKYVDQIFCVSTDDEAGFRQLGLDAKTEVQGDTRFDQVMARLKNPRAIKDSVFGDWNRTFVAGSTWPEDEAVILEALKNLSRDLNFVIVPHEPTEEHLHDLETSIKDLGLKSQRYSKTQTHEPGAVLIVDEMGLLAEIYQKAKLAFVGGSFRKQVHSVMEPLAAGAFTLVGPKHTNNREALQFQQVRIGSHTAVVEVRDGKLLSEKLIELAQAPESMKSLIQKEVELRSGKSDVVAKWCLKRMGLTKFL